MSVAAIVVNYNAGDWLLACVQSLLDNHITDVRVADNASTDDSFARLRGRYGSGSGVQALANPTNLGFGAAVNACMAQVTSDFVLVINPDCTLAGGALEKLTTALEENAKAALAGPRVISPDGSMEAASCRYFPTPRKAFMAYSGLSRWSSRFSSLEGVAVKGSADWIDTRRVEAVSGACLLLRRTAFVEVNGFDERYELHGEDLDLMFRLAQKGWERVFVPSATAFHEQGVSSASRPAWVHRQKHRGMARFFNQHVAPGHGVLTRLLVRLGIVTHLLLTWPLRWFSR